MSDSDDDCLSRTMTSERSDADFSECFGETNFKKGQPQDPFAPDDDYFLKNHRVVDGLYVSDLVAPPEDEFPVGSKAFVVADIKELKQTMGPYFFEEKMFRLVGGARRITGKVIRHHGDYTVVEFVMPLEDMFSGTHTRKLGGGGFRRMSLQHRKSITLSPTGQTLYPNVSSTMSPLGDHVGATHRRTESFDTLGGTCAPPPSAFAGGLDETQRPTTSNSSGLAVGHPEVKKLSLGGLNLNGVSNNSGTSPRRTARGGPASPRTPRGGAALMTPRTVAAQSEKIIVRYTLHRSVIEVEEM